MECQLERHLRGNQFRKFLEGQMGNIRKKYGMKEIELDILLYLTRNPEENTAKDIQRYLYVNKGYLSQVLDVLCTNGYLCAAADENDRRFMHYVPTALVKPVLEELLQARRSVEEKLFAGISEEELTILKQIAGRIDANIQSILKDGV